MKDKLGWTVPGEAFEDGSGAGAQIASLRVQLPKLPPTRFQATASPSRGIPTISTVFDGRRSGSPRSHDSLSSQSGP